MAQIKKDTSLRKAILQAAITGQLISDVEDATETGKHLLDRIIEERNNKLLAEWEEALKKNPKAKKPATVVASEIDEDEIPFEIPENWCWCRLGELGDYKKGPFGSSLTKAMFVPKSESSIKVYEQKNAIKKDFSLGDYYITMEYYKKSMTGFTVYPKDIIVSCAGTIGETYIIPDEAPIGIINQALMIMRITEQISSQYFLYLFDYLIKNQSRDYSKGTAINNIPPFAVFKNLIIPLPPLAVQNAIVAKLEQVLPLVDTYENAVLQKEELKSTLSDKVKKAILQEAITGKLTESWRSRNKFGMTDNCHAELVSASQETGKQLLDRIISERNAKALADWEEKVKENAKAKKPVPVVASEIEEDEIPFEVPEGWCWCRLGDVGDFVRGSGIKRDETRPEGFPCIRYGEMYTKYKNAITETVSFVDKDVFDSCQKIIKNDIVMALTGENEYDIALAAVYQGDKEVAMGGDMTRLRPCIVNPLYLVFTLNSPYGIECKSELATGNIIVHISNDKLGSIMIPLPPLEEQEEIVKKVEELLPLCNLGK